MDSTSVDGTRPHLLQILWRQKGLVVAVTLAAALIGILVAQLQPKSYRSTARLVLKDPRGISILEEGRQMTGVLDPTRFVRNQAQYLTGTPVLARASQLLQGRQTEAQIRSQLVVTPAKEADVITLTVTAPAPTQAAEVANAVGGAYQEVARAQNRQEAEVTHRELLGRSAVLRERIDRLKADIGTVLPDRTDDGYNTQRTAAVSQLLGTEARADEVLIDASLFGSGVELFEPARPQGAPVSPRPLGAGLVAGFLGALAACVLAWWRSEHRRTARDRDDATAVLGVPLLGEVADFRAAGVASCLPARDAPATVVGDAYHFVVASIGFALANAGGRGGSAVLVTSAAPSEGKTVTAANLAIAARRDGRRVVLVDADQRARGLTELTGVPPEPGLSDLSSAQVPLPYVTSTMPLPGGVDLPVVPAGRYVDDPAAFFRTDTFRQSMARLKDSADLVLVDAPPLLAVSDTSAVAAQVDGIVLVVAVGTPLRALEDLRERLMFVGTPVLGYVFNRSALPRVGNGYGYGNQPARSPRSLGRLGHRVRQTV